MVIGTSIQHRFAVSVLALIAAALPTAPASGVTFQFDIGPDLQTLQAGTEQEQQLAADVIECFAFAGEIWAARFTDAIDVNIDIDFSPLGTNVLGSTDSFTVGKSYASVRSALVGDARTPQDQTAAAHLQPGPNLDMLTNDSAVAGAAPVVRDNDGSYNNSTLDINRATAKALGLILPRHPSADASITFSSEMDWDFNRGDGITSNTFDFVGVAVHEIAHTLGFVSGVDIVDIASAPDGPSAPLDLSNYRVFGVNDLYHYSAASLAEANQPSTGAVLDLSVGGTPYFSLDAGATPLADYSTGRHNGDGNQASHWKAGQDTGIMGPTQLRGSQANPSAMDLLALDVIGYNRTSASWGDFDASGAVDAADIDAQAAALLAASDDVAYDLTYDNILAADDRDALIGEFLNTEYGDADLDGVVNLSDFVTLKNNFGAAAGAGWAVGDFTGDGTVNLSDFVVLKNNFGASNVPEPATALLMAAGAVGAVRPRRQTPR